MIRAWTVQSKKESSIFLKVQSEHRQVVSSKFPKSSRGASDLVVFYDDRPYNYDGCILRIEHHNS